MKKALFILFCLAVGFSHLAAQIKSRDDLSHIQLRRLSWWHPDYLTVVYDGFYRADNEKLVDDVRKLKEGCCPDLMTYDGFQGSFIFPGGGTPHLGDYLLQVDGVDAKGWSERDFKAAVADGKKHELMFRLVNYGVDLVADHVGAYTPSYASRLWGFQGRSIHLPEYQQLSKLSFYGQNHVGDVFWDRDIDWSKFKTFDFVLRGNDPLVDKELFKIIAESLNKFSMLTRDSENPDLLITISRNSDQSITYSYVPPTREVIDHGSTTRPTYSWTGKFQGYETEKHNEVVARGGYEKEMATSSVFLEICMLDASRINDPVPPMVYKMTVDFTVNKKLNVMDVYRKFAGFVSTPIRGQVALQELELNLTQPAFTTDSQPDPCYNPGRYFDAYDYKWPEGRILQIDEESAGFRKYGIKEGDILSEPKVKRNDGVQKVTYKISSNGKTRKISIERGDLSSFLFKANSLLKLTVPYLEP